MLCHFFKLCQHVGYVCRLRAQVCYHLLQEVVNLLYLVANGGLAFVNLLAPPT
jgi:hypothetical protein